MKIMNNLEEMEKKYDLVYQDDMIIIMHNFHKGYIFVHDELLKYDYEKFISLNNKRHYLKNNKYQVVFEKTEGIKLSPKKQKETPHVILALIILSVIISLISLNSGILGITPLKTYMIFAFNPQLFSSGFTSPITLFTYAFIHFSYTHLLFNMFFAYLFGSKTELLLGKFKTVIFVLLTIIGSSLIISTTNNNVFIGGLSGVGYALITFAILGQYIHPYRFKNDNNLKSMVILLLFNIVYSFFVPNVSISGHLLGIAFGILFFIIYFIGDRHDN